MGAQRCSWTGDGVADPAVSSTTVSMSSDRAVTAQFVKVWDLTVVADPLAGGNVTGSGTFDDGADAPITAEANPAYRFDGWMGDGVSDPGASATTVSMTADRSVTAQFVKVWDLTAVRSR